MHGEDAADLHFELDGGPFEWWRFHLPHIAGHVHWRGQQLTLSNIRSDFYGGQAAGSAQFHFRPGGQADYQFAVFATNALLGPLTKDMFVVTNRLEGRLWGNLVVTNASTASVQTWDGYGDLHLRDGFIWEIPVFGIFSDVLNGMVPGLGSSRASAGTCTFVITNGIIRSEDMDIRSTGMRLQYRGTLDFDGKINARVEAGILRDMPLFGQVFSTVLWPVTKLFEYKVTGTLGAPKAEPVLSGSESRAPALPVAVPSPAHAEGVVAGGPWLQPHERAAAHLAQTELTQPGLLPGWNEFHPYNAASLGRLVRHHALVGRAVGARAGFAAIGRRAGNALPHLLVSALRLLAAAGPSAATMRRT